MPRPSATKGDPGLVAAARHYFDTHLPLDDFFQTLPEPDDLRHFLDNHTYGLRLSFPETSRANFGAARKTLNLFLRAVVYSSYFSDHYRLPKAPGANMRAIQWLEIPLDSHVAAGIQEELPQKGFVWRSIKLLTPEEHDAWQGAAMEIARKEKTARVHLDLKWWRREIVSEC